MTEDFSAANINNIDQVIVDGRLNLSGPGKSPVYGKHRDVPLLEYVDTKLKELLFEVPNLSARDFDRIRTEIREHLSSKDMRFQIIEVSDD